MIVADTGALVALIDADDQHHGFMRNLFEQDPWVLPWAVLPEVDYLIFSHVGDKAAYALMADLADGIYLIDWGDPGGPGASPRSQSQLSVTSSWLGGCGGDHRSRATECRGNRHLGFASLRCC